jgi:hypothetical protein
MRKLVCPYKNSTREDYAVLKTFNIPFTKLSSDKTTYDLFENPWSNSNTKFESTGWFCGYNVVILNITPKLAQIGEHIFVSDSKG